MNEAMTAWIIPKSDDVVSQSSGGAVKRSGCAVGREDVKPRKRAKAIKAIQGNAQTVLDAFWRKSP